MLIVSTGIEWAKMHSAQQPSAAVAAGRIDGEEPPGGAAAAATTTSSCTLQRHIRRFRLVQLLLVSPILLFILLSLPLVLLWGTIHPPPPPPILHPILPIYSSSLLLLLVDHNFLGCSCFFLLPLLISPDHCVRVNDIQEEEVEEVSWWMRCNCTLDTGLHPIDGCLVNNPCTLGGQQLKGHLPLFNPLLLQLVVLWDSGWVSGRGNKIVSQGEKWVTKIGHQPRRTLLTTTIS